MSPNRRQFVAALTTVPFLVQPAGAQRRAPTANADPVLDQILSELRALGAEFDTQPRSRKSSMRAMESTLGAGAAHMAANYDAAFRQGLRRSLAREGRAALLQHVLNRDQKLSYDTVDAAMTRLEQRGLSGCFRDVQETIRKVRLQVPDQIAMAGAGAIQYDYCSDLNWMIAMMEAVSTIACAIAILEPTVGGEIACGAFMLMLGLLYAQRLLWC